MFFNALLARVEIGSEEHSFRPVGWSLSGLRPSFSTPRAPIGEPYRTLIGVGGRFSVGNPVVGGRFSAPPGFGRWAFHRGKVGDSLGMFYPGGRCIVDNSTPAQWAIHRAESVNCGYPGAKGIEAVRRIANQLELLGLEETRRRLAAEGATKRERERLLQRVEVSHALMSDLPSADDLSFLHSGLCQTCLPHSKPSSNIAVWRRSSGRFSLIVSPGVVDETPLSKRGRQPTPDEIERMYVGVPYGSKARLILIHLQTEGMRSRTVSLGPTLSAFLRSLGLPVSGGPRGSIQAIREQSLRIARCTFTMQWTDTDADGAERTLISDSKIVDGLEL